MERHKIKIHGNYSSRKCDFKTTFEADFKNHEITAHRVICPSCTFKLPKFQTMETHNCPKVLGPGKPSPEELSQLTLSKSDHRFAKKTSQGKHLCLECGLLSSTKRFILDHIMVIINILLIGHAFKIGCYFAFRFATVGLNAKSVILRQVTSLASKDMRLSPITTNQISIVENAKPSFWTSKVS